MNQVTGKMSFGAAIVFCHLAVLVFCGACAKKETAPQPVEPAAQTVETASQPVVAAADPAENLGLKIGSSYIETMRQIVAVLRDKPAADDAKAMLTDMKNWTIELMVGLGKEREALPAMDRDKVDRTAQNKIAAIPADLFKEYQEGQSFYKDNPELYNLIGDFNTITQYAFFDLLKKQLPEEASRLGIQ